MHQQKWLNTQSLIFSSNRLKLLVPYGPVQTYSGFCICSECAGQFIWEVKPLYVDLNKVFKVGPVVSGDKKERPFIRGSFLCSPPAWTHRADLSKGNQSGTDCHIVIYCY